MTDSDARQIVINGIDRNVFTPAGAGSGKTTSLVERLVKMVKEGIKVDNICTITFTVTAANEFYQRFQKRLIKEAGSIEKTDKDYKLNPIYIRIIDALNNIDNCFMGTIDSFFQTVVKENAVNSDFPIGITITSMDDFELFIDNEFEKFSKSSDPLIKNKIDEIVKYFGKNSKDYFKACIQNIYPYRKYKIDYKQVYKSDIDNLENNYKNEIIKLLKYAVDDPLIGCNNVKSNGPNTKQIEIYDNFVKNYDVLNCNWFDNIERIKDYINVISEYIPNSKTNIKTALKPKKMPQEYEDFINEIKDVKTNVFPDISNTISSYYSTVLFDNSLFFMDTIYQDKIDNSIILFDDVIQTFYDLLIADLNDTGHNKCSMINRIKKRYQYYLLDEFQDTRPICSNIFYILASTKPDADITKCVLDPGKLFIVGDSKQSIYKFSGADYVAFNRIGNLFDNNPLAINIKAKLTKNFRSVDGLKKWFNTKFRNMFVPTTYQTNFDDIEIFKGNERINHFTDLDGNKENNTVFKYETDKDTEFDKIVKIINTIVKNDRYKIEYTEKDEDDVKHIVNRPLEFSDIMIITSKKESLSQYANVFSKNNIPFYIEGNNDFTYSKSLLTVMSILSVLINNDDVSFYKFLSSDLIKLSDDQILYLKKNKLFKLTAEAELKKCGYDALVEPFNKINKLKDQSYGLPLSSIFERVLTEFDILNKTNKVGYQYTFSALESLKAAEFSGEVSNLNEGLMFLNNLLDTKQERSFSINGNQNAIHLANLHKVKGMEAPVVILALSGAKYPDPCAHIDNINGVYYPIKPKLKGILKSSYSFKGTHIDDFIDMEKEAEKAEVTRLLYVAATRAENMLIISDKLKKSQSSENYWKDLLDSDTKEFQIEERTNKSDIAIPNYKYEDLYESNVKLSNTSTYKIIRPSDDFKYNQEQKQEVSNIKKELSATLIGTVVHKLMESIVTSNFKIDCNELVKNVLNKFNVELKYYDLFVSICNKMLKDGYTQEKGITNLFKYLKENNAKCYCEVPFATKDGKEIISGIIDLIYTIDDINYYIVDYKTDNELKDINANHKKQLSLYEKAFKENNPGCNVESYIYHIEITD